jgi:uncharacterized protein YbjT (DUF2867 family)
MTYVIAGVSGNTGKVAAETLLAQGKSVRVLVRDAAKGAPWAARGAEVAIADLYDAASLTAALKGAAAAYLLVPPLFSDDFVAHQARTTAALTTAIRDSAIPHVVFLSSVGAQHAAGTGPIAGLNRAERTFRELSPRTAFTFIRAAYFMENLGGSLAQLGQGVLPSFLPADFRFDMIATVDIGRLAAAELLAGPKGLEIVELGGPARSMKDAAAILSELTHRPVAVHEAPVAMAATILGSIGFPPALAALYQEMLTGIGSGHVAWEGGHRHVQGSTPLEHVLAGLVAGAAH